MLKQQPTMQQSVPSPQHGIQRMFLIALAVAIVLAAGFCIIIISSLIPYFGVIGIMAVVVVGVALFCLAVLLLSYTSFRIDNWGKKKNLLVAGDVVIFIDDKGQFIHLSAQHEAAKVPLLNAPVVQGSTSGQEDESLVDDSTVLELYEHGNTLRTIADTTGLSYYKVQQIVAKKRGKS